MSAQVYQTQFRQEFIATFEQTISMLGASVTRETVMKGNTATFLVAGSGGATAVTRGVNGLIPARQDDMTQLSATLVEWHDLVQMTGFNMFANQGDSRRIMHETVRGVIGRKIDSDILAALDNTTLDAGNTAAPFSLNTAVWARTILGNNDVPIWEEDNMFFVITPAAEGYLMQTKEFASADFIDVKPFTGPMKRYRRWMGFNWIVHPNLTGAGTSAEKCYAFHRRAIGHAANSTDMALPSGYDEMQDYSWARASIFMGSKLLQNSGIVRVNHDGSAYAAT